MVFIYLLFFGIGLGSLEISQIPTFLWFWSLNLSLRTYFHLGPRIQVQDHLFMGLTLVLESSFSLAMYSGACGQIQSSSGLSPDSNSTLF